MNEKEELSNAQIQNLQRFFDASETLFERFGYQKTTVQDVCKAAGMSKPTFYGLLKDKTELFVRMIINICEVEIKDWEVHLDENINPAQKLLSFIDFIAKFYASRPIFGTIFKDPLAMEKFAWILYKSPSSPILSSLHNILTQGVAYGHFRKLNPDAVIWMIYSILDTMYILMPMMTGEPGACENPEIAKEVKSFILSAVGGNNEEE